MYKHQKWPSAHSRSIPHSFWYSLAFAVTFFGIYAGLVLGKYTSLSNPVPADLAVALGGFASFVVVWIGVKRFPEEQNAASDRLPLQRLLRFWVPLAFSIALLFQGFGSSIVTYYDIHAITAPPLLGMILILGRYPLLLVGIFLLPRDTLLGKLPLRFVIDSLMLITTLFTFSWYFLLGPALFESLGVPLFAKAIITTYAIFDLLLVSCLILLSRSIADQGLRRTLRVVSLAMMVFVLADSILLFQGLHSSSPDTTWPGLGWIGANFAIALSLQALRWLSARTTTTKAATPHPSSLAATPLWRSLLTYALVPAVIALVLSVWSTDRTSILAIGTYICSALLLIVIFVKQFVAMQEIHGLNQGFQHLNRLVDEKNAALQQANTHLQVLATTDPLTELPNHRALVKALDQEVARAQQYQRSCSLLFFDLDHFKALNDGYGHAGGDIALREFGSLLRNTLPLIHTVGRWGGEEFVVILPEQNSKEAAAIAEELRSAAASHSFGIGGGMHLTCSIGVASFPAHAQQQKFLLQAADSAMYAAKRLGRNQVRVIDDPAVTALLATHAAVEGRDEVTLIGTVHALELLVEKHDIHTRERGQRVGELLLQLAPTFGISEAEAQLLSLAGQLHDVGKIVIPDSILQKEPDELTEQERACLHQHPHVGAEVISSIPSLRSIAPIINAHHECWNGTGYPDQQAGEAIPLGARLLAVVDAYVSMTHAHSASIPDEHNRALAALRQGAGNQFDPAAVEQFLLLLTRTQISRDVLRIT